MVVLASCSSEGPHCATCYYHYHVESGLLLFASAIDSRHVLELAIGPGRRSRDPDQLPLAAWSIAYPSPPEDVGELRGAQCYGHLFLLNSKDEPEREMINAYIIRYPATNKVLELRGDHIAFYALKSDRALITDNRVSYGHKERWRM